MKIRGEDYLEYVYFSQFRIPVEGFVFDGAVPDHRGEMRPLHPLKPAHHVWGLGRCGPVDSFPCQQP